MSDEELDSVFRRVADEYPQDTPPPAAWERLETQLATAATTQQLRRKVVRGFSAEVVTLALLLWLGYELLPRLAQVNRLPGAALPASSHSVAPLSRPLAVPEAHSAHPQASLPGLASAKPDAWASPVSPVLPMPGSARRIQQDVAVTSSPALPALVPGWRAAQRHRNTVFTIENKDVVSRERVQRTATRLTDSSEPGLAEAAETTRVAQLAPGNYPLPDSLGGLALLPPADSTKEQKRPALRPPYRLVVGLLGAPSFSAVRTPQTAQLGGDYGLTLEYVLTPRLRVRAGLISSQKRYRAASSDYVAPASWQWFSGDYMLAASCRVTEIPLDVRFDVLRRPTYAVFTSLGINSLLMRNEQYSYDWTMNGHTYTKTAQVLAGSTHFLSVLNVAVGVERPIGGRWSAQVEPFWQIPLGGVGAGQVRLSSAGAAFSLKFGLIR